MPLTKAQRTKLREAGLSREQRDAVAGLFDAGDDDTDDDTPRRRKGDKPKRERRVFVLQGRDADEFLAGITSGRDGDDDDDEDDDDDDEDDDDDADDKPPTKGKWFS